MRADKSEFRPMNLRRQQGFTLVEVAIVLVIVGLLLGGILKGQELINSAQVKSLAGDFRSASTYINAYMDRFKAFPGDDSAAQSHVCPAATPACTSNGNGNGKLDGNWNSVNAADESVLIWQHLRLGGFAPGPTDTADINAFVPRNSVGGRVGLTATTPITFPTGFSGSYYACSDGILGKYAVQLDRQMDDGDTRAGSVRVALSSAPTVAVRTDQIDPSRAYVVCFSF